MLRAWLLLATAWPYLSSCPRCQQGVSTPKLQNRVVAGAMLDQLVTDRLDMLEVSLTSVIVHKGSSTRVHSCSIQDLSVHNHDLKHRNAAEMQLKAN
jgi:hypothetical protein